MSFSAVVGAVAPTLPIATLAFLPVVVVVLAIDWLRVGWSPAVQAAEVEVTRVLDSLIRNGEGLLETVGTGVVGGCEEGVFVDGDLGAHVGVAEVVASRMTNRPIQSLAERGWSDLSRWWYLLAERDGSPLAFVGAA